jgi:hypothetical protein
VARGTNRRTRPESSIFWWAAARLLVACGLTACERPRQIAAPEIPAEARTLIYVDLAEGRDPRTVWVRDPSSEEEERPFTLANDQTRYALWYRRSLTRLGLVPGPNPVVPGARSTLPADGILRLEDDGRWAKVSEGDQLNTPPVFSLQSRCERIIEGALEPWPEPPDILSAQPIDADTALITTRGRQIMTLHADGRVERLLSSEAPILAVTHDGDSVYVLDEDFNLIRHRWNGLTTTTTTSLGPLEIPANARRGVAEMAIEGDGTVHLYLDYSWPSERPNENVREARVLRLDHHTFRRWAVPECGEGRPRHNSVVSPARRLATAPDGLSVVAGSVCDEGILRWRGSANIELTGRISAVRRLGPVLYAGTTGETVLSDDPATGQWRQVYRSVGGRILHDVADFAGEGLLVVGFSNQLSQLTLSFPATEDEEVESCFLAANWDRRTREIVRLGDHFLVIPQPQEGANSELPPQRLRLRYTDD